LNQLVSEKKKNEQIAKNAFEQRVKETKQKAIEENKKNAEKYGNVITQDIDKEGNLIGVSETQQSNDTESISVADIRTELFDGENVVVGKTDYGQSQLKSGPFAK
jgi:DNA topoisomerase IA